MIEKIDHIGIAVHNLDGALERYERLFGLRPIKVETHEDIHVRMAFLRVGEVLIELLEPTEQGAGRIGEFLQEQGEGVHHIAFRVGDINNAIATLKALEAPLRDTVPRDGGDDSRIAFIDPAATMNVLTELVERDREVRGEQP
jgi:methylmalonyl-CoA/ethylmalonyl-CoA epimerase